MENTVLKQTKQNANELLFMVFGKDVLNYELGFKDYDDDNYLGGYEPDSISSHEPKVYLNKNFRENFTNKGIYDKNTHQAILTDTVLHEYGHMLYDIIDSSQTSVIDNVNDFLREELEEHLSIEQSVGEGGELVYIVTKDGQVKSEVLDDEGLSEYLDHEVQEFFAENLVTYLRLLEGDGGYLKKNENLNTNPKRERFYEVVLGQIVKMKQAYFEEEPTLKLPKKDKIELSLEEYEGETEITVYYSGKPVGRCDYSIQDMDSFIQYEIDEYLDQRMEDQDIESYEVDRYMSLKEEIEDKSMVYFITSLEIDHAYKNKGFGTKLLTAVLKHINDEITNLDMPESIVYLNASPPYGSLTLQNLVKFYKKMGFEEKVLQAKNCIMSINDTKNIKKFLQEETKSSPLLRR